MFKAVFSIPPGWIKNVQKNGTPAKAEIISDPKDNMKGVQGYEGRDVWLEVKARLEPENEAPYEVNLKCQLSQILFGMLEKGMKVNVKYDPLHKDRAVLMDDAQALLMTRIKK